MRWSGRTAAGMASTCRRGAALPQRAATDSKFPPSSRSRVVAANWSSSTITSKSQINASATVTTPPQRELHRASPHSWQRVCTAEGPVNSASLTRPESKNLALVQPSCRRLPRTHATRPSSNTGYQNSEPRRSSIQRGRDKPWPESSICRCVYRGETDHGISSSATTRWTIHLVYFSRVSAQTGMTRSSMHTPATGSRNSIQVGFRV